MTLPQHRTGYHIRLVSVIVWLYLILIHVMLAFSLLFSHYVSSSRLQYPTHSYININHISLLSPNQHYNFKLNHFRIHFVDNKFEKIIISKFKIRYIK
jgi:hypothetical protein